MTKVISTTLSQIKVTIDWSILLALNTISNGELSDPLCDSINRGLTLVRSIKELMECHLDTELNDDLRLHLTSLLSTLTIFF